MSFDDIFAHEDEEDEYEDDEEYKIIEWFEDGRALKVFLLLVV